MGPVAWAACLVVAVAQVLRVLAAGSRVDVAWQLGCPAEVPVVLAVAAPVALEPVVLQLEHAAAWLVAAVHLVVLAVQTRRANGLASLGTSLPSLRTTRTLSLSQTLPGQVAATSICDSMPATTPLVTALTESVSQNTSMAIL